MVTNAPHQSVQQAMQYALRALSWLPVFSSTIIVVPDEIMHCSVFPGGKFAVRASLGAAAESDVPELFISVVQCRIYLSESFTRKITCLVSL